MKNPSSSKITLHLGVAACLIVVISASGIFAVEQTQPVSPAASPVTPPAATNSAAISSPGQPAVVAGPIARQASATAEGNGQKFRVYMPDGQLKSHLIRVYVNRDILPDQNPRIQLLRSHAVTRKAPNEAALEKPAVVAPGQEWIESVEGKEIRQSGTVLLFDINKTDFGLRAMLRVMPVVSWTDGGIARVAIATSEVNVGSIVAAICWTSAAVGLALLLVIGLSWRAGSNPILLLTGVDGHLSLAQTQVACWTVAVGSVVLGYGLIRLQIPDIPSSLLVLMGTSLATGGLAYFKDAQKQQVSIAAGAAPVKRPLALGDIVRVFTPGKQPELSLAKAQMLFWTALLLVLFLTKSILDGAIWEVPWPLVALMGFSQAGYLAPKLVSPP